MAIVTREEDVEFQRYAKHRGGTLIGEQNGAVSGFCMGISMFESDEYGAMDTHDDQEGILVLEGTGMAKVGDEEFAAAPGTAWYVGAGVGHSVRRDSDSGPLKLLWTHGAL